MRSPVHGYRLRFADNYKFSAVFYIAIFVKMGYCYHSNLWIALSMLFLFFLSGGYRYDHL